MKKYQLIYEDMIAKIESGYYSSDKKLPSENVLKKEYGVSTNTLRKSLNMLIEVGYLSSRQGSGYYLSPHKNFSSLKLKSMGTTYSCVEIKSRILSFDLIQATSEDAKNLGVEVGEAIFSIKRLRSISNVPILLENTIIPVKLFPTLSQSVFNDSFYKYVTNQTNYKIDRAFKDVSAIISNEEINELFSLDGPKALLVIENYVFLSNGVQFEYSYNIHLEEKISLAINNQI